VFVACIAIKTIAAMMSLIRWMVLGLGLFGLELGLSASALAQTGISDPANTYYRYNAAQLEAVCEAMSPTLYVSGLTEGAWGVPQAAGKTYFYRSACFLEVVRRTGRAELCPKVVERRTLLGNGSAVSPASCLQEAQRFAAVRAQQAQDNAAHAKAVQGMYTLGPLTVQPLPQGGWRLQTQLQGSLAGKYRLELESSRTRQRLRTQFLVLASKQPTQTVQWELSRAEVVGQTPLPAIFPLSASLFYLPTTPEVPAAPGRAVEHLSTIQNITLSAAPFPNFQHN
jgi:hypothetical protein